MLSDYVLRGLKAGLVAGLAFGLFIALVGSPLIGVAETPGHHHDEANHRDASIVSEAVTKAVSVGAGVFWGVLFGVVTFGLAYYFLEPAVPGAPDTQSYLLGAAGFVTASGAPWLVLPPQVAGVEQGLPTDVRLLWYATMMVAGALVCVLSGCAYKRLEPEFGVPRAIVGAVLPFALLAIPVTLAPANPTHGAASNLLATSFRGFVAFGQVGLWFVLASTHAWLLRRDRGGEPNSHERIRTAETVSGASTD